MTYKGQGKVIPVQTVEALGLQEVDAHFQT
jgi:hypothetical protein